eukprot:TRINITY_DN41240_c0_g1_i1.p1 TRINITY_DN41240_c0_g1~~TRINITY_DN41240_c0_g1_i1.p1  ORF type:complete len:459 (-),score=66.38 TRINITY_DN41240_c0_g1_i1:67-1392(-)
MGAVCSPCQDAHGTSSLPSAEIDTSKHTALVDAEFLEPHIISGVQADTFSPAALNKHTVAPGDLACTVDKLSGLEYDPGDVVSGGVDETTESSPCVVEFDAGEISESAPCSAVAEGAEDVEETRQRLLAEASVAASQGQLDLAAKALEKALSIGRALGTIPVKGEADEQHWDALLSSVSRRKERVDRLIKACGPQDGDGWKQFDLDICSLWRCWDTKTGRLKLVMRWESPGSIQKQVAILREVDVAEPLWDGLCTGMTVQHAGGSTLARWLQRDPFTQRKVEVMLEREFCDCLEREMPCWVMSEASPAIENYETFQGAYGPFTISAVPQGYQRTVTEASGRLLEPKDANSCYTSMCLEIYIPPVIKWILTDSLLVLSVQLCSKNTMKSWVKIVDKWDELDWDERLVKERAFFEPVNTRIAAFFARRSAAAAAQRGVDTTPK